MFAPLDNDPRSIRAAEFKNRGKWDEARNVEYEIFQEHLRTLGADHASTLAVGYDLAEIELESSYLEKASEWCHWVTDNSRRVFGNSHTLPLRSESLMAEIICQKGKYQEAESICANVLARQQMTIGEDHLDTLDTRRRLGMAYNALNRRESAITTAEKLTDSLKRLLGENHIRVFWAMLDALDYIIYNHGEERAALVRAFEPEVQQAFELLPQVYEELRAGLGDKHPVTIRALSLHGRGLTRAHQFMEASETLRRALAVSEDALGPDHPLTMDIVGSIGVMYTLQGALQFTGVNPPSEAIPWMVRYLNWVEQRRGLDNPETQTSLEMLGNLHFAGKEYEQAQSYFERALAACRGTQATAMQQRISTQLQLCQAHTMFMTRRSPGSGIGGFLSQLQRF
jgi:tetratricopeptide (TPR) repeat protein